MLRVARILCEKELREGGPGMLSTRLGSEKEEQGEGLRRTRLNALLLGRDQGTS
jgi:hypothetical protein